MGIYLFIVSIYDLLQAFFWFSPGNWADDFAAQAIVYSLVQTVPILFAIFVVLKAEIFVRAFGLASEEDETVLIGKWDVNAIAQLALFVVSGHFVLINLVPFLTAVVDYFVDSVRPKYPYNVTPDDTGYYDFFDFISSGISLLIGAIIITNVPWFAAKLVGKYGEEEQN